MKKSHELQDHVFDTYISLRYGMAALAIAFPFLLMLVGLLHDIPVQDSLSAYYFATPVSGGAEGVFAVRTVFVGILFAVGAFLYLYKGFSNLENRLLNAAGICAWAVALLPMPWACGDQCAKVTPHGIAAVGLFVCVASVCFLCSSDTLYLLPSEKAALAPGFGRLYGTLGGLMLASPLAAFTLTLIFAQPGQYIIVVEALGTSFFGLYWWFKSRELSFSGAQQKAVQAAL